ncbi:hypothetical protein CCH79_00017494, partial [Gambusia affinis]
FEPAAEPPSLPAVTRYPSSGDVYHFSPREYPIPEYRRHFHQVDDLIQTFWYNFSVQGLLHQPAPGAASSFCFNRNPAKFLRSTSLSCTRMVTSQSCTTDPDLSSSSYYFNMSLVTVPTTDTIKLTSDLLVPVTPLSDWPAPVKQNGFCLNVVKTVEFLVYYTPRGELTNASINFTLTDVPLQQLVLQTHSVEFHQDTPRPPPEKPKLPAVGLRAGSAVMALINGEMQTLKSLGVSEAGRCSSDPSRLSPVLFTHNTINGCTFSSETQNCTELRSQIYEIFRGSTAPDEIAMNSGLQPNWTRVLIQDCQIDPQESCKSGCNLPVSFSIQIVWARQGFIEVPQNYILGAKFLFRCQNVQCPLSSPLTLTAKATFVETTVYPEAPRGVPQPHWRFPFGFFTRGAAELDGHLDTSGSSAEKSLIELCRRALAGALSRKPSPIRRATFHRKAEVSVVRPQRSPKLRPAGEHAVRFGNSSTHQVINEDADVFYIPGVWISTLCKGGISLMRRSCTSGGMVMDRPCGYKRSEVNPSGSSHTW